MAEGEDEVKSKVYWLSDSFYLWHLDDCQVDAISREDLINLVMKGKDRQKGTIFLHMLANDSSLVSSFLFYAELVELVKKAREEKDLVKVALRKARDQLLLMQVYVLATASKPSNYFSSFSYCLPSLIDSILDNPQKSNHCRYGS